MDRVWVISGATSGTRGLPESNPDRDGSWVTGVELYGLAGVGAAGLVWEDWALATEAVPIHKSGSRAKRGFVVIPIK